MRKKYLNNRDLLKEIHRSKNTYCSYVDEESAQYDLILPNLERVNIRTIAQAKRGRQQISKKYLKPLKMKKSKQTQFAIDWED